MDAHQIFHDAIKEILAPPSNDNYLVAVLLPDRSDRLEFTLDDFLIMNAKSFHTIETVRHKFDENTFNTCALVNEDAVLDDKIILEDLNRYNDNIIILLAIDLNAKTPSRPSIRTLPFLDETLQNGRVLVHLSSLLNNSNSKELKVGMKRSKELLKDLQKRLPKNIKDDQLKKLNEDIQRLTEKSFKIHIGIRGDSGSGKSTLINTLLRKDRLVPVSAQNGCTAVPIEISWNPDPSPSKRYRAKIEIISAKEWEDELKTLCRLHHQSDYNSAKEASVVSDKIRAVYPKVPLEAVNENLIVELLADAEVKSLLGKTKEIFEPDLETFRKTLEKYTADNTSRTTGNIMQVWPLVKKVQIFCDSDILRNNLVLVDLPGTADTNAARLDVARKYMRNCSKIWIVIPAFRAQTNNVSVNLLEETLCQQMVLDGFVEESSDIAIIVSKTDADMSRRDAETILEKNKITNIIEEHRAAVQVYEDATNKLKDLNDERERCVRLLSESQGFQSSVQKHGIKGSSPAAKRHKSLKSVEWQVQSLDVEEILEIESDPSSDSESSMTVLSVGRISVGASKSARGLRQMRTKENTSNLRPAKGYKTANASTPLENKLHQLATQIVSAMEISDKAGREVRKLENCIIKGAVGIRNRNCKAVIKEKFPDMIREICLGKRLTDNRLFGEAFSKVLHDMKNDLPVFCVSSHAYNHFCDSENEKAAGMGFNLKGQTGIGDLRDFCEKMESRDRVVDYKAFLTDVQQVLLQLKSWTEGAFTCAAMTEDEMEEEVKYFRDSMENLTTDFENARERCTEDVKKNILVTINRIKKSSVQESVRTTWKKVKELEDSKPNRNANTGLDRAGGPFSEHKINEKLFTIFAGSILPDWQAVFTVKTYEVFTEGLRETLSSLLQEFHDDIQWRSECSERRLITDVSRLVKQKDYIIKKKIGLVDSLVNRAIKSLKSDALQEARLAISEHMEPIYDEISKGKSFQNAKAKRKRLFSEICMESPKMYTAAMKRFEEEIVRTKMDLNQGIHDHLQNLLCVVRESYEMHLGVTQGRSRRAVVMDVDVGKQRQRIRKILAESQQRNRVLVEPGLLVKLKVTVFLPDVPGNAETDANDS